MTTRIFLPLLATGLLSAQTAQTWSGLLVASGCQVRSTPGSSASAAKPGRERNSTYEQQAQSQAGGATSAASTAPGKQDPAMARTTDRGTPVEKTIDPLDRTTTPPIDDKGTRGKAGMNKTGSEGALDPAGMDASCRIGTHTAAFALQTEDGKLVQFDPAANSKIQQQLHTEDRLGHKTKVFRTKVKGVMQNGLISIDSIEI